jgi:hypothetical protein
MGQLGGGGQHTPRANGVVHIGLRSWERQPGQMLVGSGWPPPPTGSAHGPPVPAPHLGFNTPVGEGTFHFVKSHRSPNQQTKGPCGCSACANPPTMGSIGG